MDSQSRHQNPPPQEFELHHYSDGDDDDYDQTDGLLHPSTKPSSSHPQKSKSKSASLLNLFQLLSIRRPWPIYSLLPRKYRTRRLQTLLLQMISISTAVLTLVVIFTAIFLPSPYAKYPTSYTIQGFDKDVLGSGNPANEKVFIAANIVDEGLIRGRWGQAVQELVNLLGPRNTFLSIYENDSGPGTKAALKDLRESISCPASIVSSSLPLSLIPTINPPFATHPLTKRITYLATIRNLALLPLTFLAPTNSYSPAISTSMSNKNFRPVQQPPSTYTKILFLNDVLFSPTEAISLLFRTNNGTYAAACAIDFINPVKYYDTYALRDINGDGPGLPLYPFFARGQTRQQILAGSDMIPVRSCWGGMIAFDATPFTRQIGTTGYNETPPVIFRSEASSPTWDASECCLIHADISDAPHTFLNPFIRTAYGSKTFALLPLATRIERLWVYPHAFLSWIVGMPWANPRRDEKEGDVVWRSEVESESGKMVDVERVAGKGGYCGSRRLQIIEDLEDGRRKWRPFKLPDGV